MHVIKLAVAIVSLASPALADCGPGRELFMSCTVEGQGKRLEICFDRAVAVYRFGRPGAPELELAAPIAGLAYRPWPGVGSSIWEEVDFENAGHLYTVSAGVDRRAAGRDGDEAGVMWGQVEVTRGGESLATLRCIPDSVAFPWTQALYLAKEAAGLSWDYTRHEWVAAQE